MQDGGGDTRLHTEVVGSTLDGPMPPTLHWALVLLLSIVTIGAFKLIWLFAEAAFVKRLDRKNPALMLLISILLLAVVSAFLLAIAAGMSEGDDLKPALVALPTVLGMVACALVAIFKMRRSMITYYNSVEPIGLRLNSVMTLFFSIYYFQYHFRRIALMKKAGQL